MMRLVSLTILCALFALSGKAQRIGSVTTEQYQAEFEKKMSIDAVPEYTDTIKIPIQLLKVGINEELFELYPELKDKRVGLGVTNIVLEYLEYTNRFVFTEDKKEIKERMVNQFKASEKGFTENKLDGRGKIKLAKYFVYIEVYDFSVSDDEVVKMNGEAKTIQVTRLGLQVKFVDADSQFEKITGNFDQLEFDIVDPLDQVNVIERSIRTIKERIWCLIQNTLYRRIPKLMVKHLVETATRNLNQFPSEGGISSKYSLLTIVIRRPNPNYQDFPIDYRAYTEVFEDNGWAMNTNRPRATPAICIGPTPYRSGGQFFMSLVTGRRLRRKQ